MSSIGFAPGPPDEVEQLRSAYKSINDVTRNIAGASKCIKEHDLRMADHYLRAAEWHAGQAKLNIAAVGKSKRKNTKTITPAKRIS